MAAITGRRRRCRKRRYYQGNGSSMADPLTLAASGTAADFMAVKTRGTMRPKELAEAEAYVANTVAASETVAGKMVTADAVASFRASLATGKSN